MQSFSRRDFLGLAGTGALTLLNGRRPRKRAAEFRIRTITAGVELRSASDLDHIENAIAFLSSARARFSDAYEVQTMRIATQPIADYLPSWLNRPSLAAVQKLDEAAAGADAMLNIGPVLRDDEAPDGFASWIADLVQATTNTSCSSFVASRQRGVHHRGVRAAAAAIAAIAHATTGGEGNFRFCATAFCPPGTPFFPAAYHEGKDAFSIGLESPRLLLSALEGTRGLRDAEKAMAARLNAALSPVEALARKIERETGWRYLGIDTSPAPGLDSSIGQVIETLAGAPFGSPSTLSACAAITNVLKGVRLMTCGYSGLMLPVLEDRVLADRAVEDRYGIPELLLYSSVCGTGLDVVPLPGDSSVAALAATIGDVASLAARYGKALSARLFPVPGKVQGDIVSFDNPFLTRSKVMALG